MKRLLSKVCRRLEADGSLAVIITDFRRIMKLNMEYFGRNRPTDVLAFDLAERSRARYLEGEIYVCLPQVRKQAMEEGVPLEEEFARICLHGLLHLLGYDDKKKRDRDLMWKAQESLLKGSFDGIKFRWRTSREKE